LAPSLRGYLVAELPVLGCTLYHRDLGNGLAAGLGTDDGRLDAVAGHVQRLADSLAGHVSHGLPLQAAGAILRHVATGAPQHLLRARRWPADALARFDDVVVNAWGRLLGTQLSAEQRRLGALPVRMGGLALGLAAPRAEAAFLAGWRREATRRSDNGAYLSPADVLAAGGEPLLRQLVAAGAALATTAPKLAGAPELDLTARAPADLQKNLMAAVWDAEAQAVLGQGSFEERARLRSQGGPGAGAFLQAPLPEVPVIPNGAWRVAALRRVSATAAQLVAPATPETQCQHRSPDRLCGEDVAGPRGQAHAATCKLGGGVVRVHNAVRDALATFIRRRVAPDVLCEQRLEGMRPAAAMEVDAGAAGGDGGDRLDVCWHSDQGSLIAVDIAVVHADSADAARTRAAASRDGAAAERQERHKRTRYSGLRVTPFVLEAGGRPGPAAAGLVRMLAHQAAGPEGASRVAAELWQRISVALHTAQAQQLLAGLLRPASLAGALSR